MSKIPPNIENPIDNILIDSISLYDKHINTLGITPNMITIFRIVLFLTTYFYLKDDKLILISYIIFYYLDCVDGYIARKYDKITVSGDYLDHLADIIAVILMLYKMYPYLTSRNIIILVIFLFGQLVHLGCQQKYFNDSGKIKESLDIFISLCKYNIKYTRYLGCGTTILVICLMFYYKIIYKNTNNN